MGAVHLAHDLLLDRPVAVKRLRDPWLEEADAKRSLVAEDAPWPRSTIPTSPACRTCSRRRRPRW